MKAVSVTNNATSAIGFLADKTMFISKASEQRKKIWIAIERLVDQISKLMNEADSRNKAIWDRVDVLDRFMTKKFADVEKRSHDYHELVGARTKMEEGTQDKLKNLHKVYLAMRDRLESFERIMGVYYDQNIEPCHKHIPAIRKGKE